MKKIYTILGILLISFVQVFGQAEFNTGTFEVVVNSYGRIRLYTPPPSEIRQLQRASILVGVSPDQVFDYSEDSDSYEPTVLVSDPQHSDFEIYGAYNNGYSLNPPDVIIRLNAYGWTNKSFTVLKFNIENKETSAINAVIGLDVIPELNEEYGSDTVTFDATHNILRFHRAGDLNMGIKALSDNFSSLSYFEWFDGYSTDENYWDWMTSGELQSQYASESDDGLVAVTGQPAVSIEPDQSADAYFALAIGDDYAELIDNLNEAKQKYDELILGLTSIDSPGFWLDINQPNPFNGSTAINYSLPASGKVQLTILDRLGRVIAIPVEGIQAAGVHQIRFDAESLAAGIYFYTLNFNAQRITQKMVITD